MKQVICYCASKVLNNKCCEFYVSKKQANSHCFKSQSCLTTTILIFSFLLEGLVWFFLTETCWFFFTFFFFLLGKHNLMSVKFVLWKNISIDKMGVVRVSHIQFLLRNRREAETGMLQNWASVWNSSGGHHTVQTKRCSRTDLEFFFWGQYNFLSKLWLIWIYSKA